MGTAALLTLTPLALAETAPSLTIPSEIPAPRTFAAPTSERQRAAVVVYLRHIYSIYYGIRSCTEISDQQQDRHYLPLLQLDEARKRLRLIDKAVGEVGLDAGHIWREAAPVAEMTGEMLKNDPPKHLPYCQRMASLFRMDADNLEVILTALGAKTTLVPKDF